MKSSGRARPPRRAAAQAAAPAVGAGYGDKEISHSFTTQRMSTHGWLRLEVLEQEPLHALLMAADLRIGLQCSKAIA